MALVNDTQVDRRLEAARAIGASETPSGTFYRRRTGIRGGTATVKGTAALYRVALVREYDENDSLVAVGSETDPLDTGHTLKLTYDVMRATA